MHFNLSFQFIRKGYQYNNQSENKKIGGKQNHERELFKKNYLILLSVTLPHLAVVSYSI